LRSMRRQGQRSVTLCPNCGRTLGAIPFALGTGIADTCGCSDSLLAVSAFRVIPGLAMLAIFGRTSSARVPQFVLVFFRQSADSSW